MWFPSSIHAFESAVFVQCVARPANSRGRLKGHRIATGLVNRARTSGNRFQTRANALAFRETHEKPDLYFYWTVVLASATGRKHKAKRRVPRSRTTDKKTTRKTSATFLWYKFLLVCELSFIHFPTRTLSRKDSHLQPRQSVALVRVLGVSWAYGDCRWYPGDGPHDHPGPPTIVVRFLRNSAIQLIGIIQIALTGPAIGAPKPGYIERRACRFRDVRSSDLFVAETWGDCQLRLCPVPVQSTFPISADHLPFRYNVLRV